MRARSRELKSSGERATFLLTRRTLRVHSAVTSSRSSCNAKWEEGPRDTSRGRRTCSDGERTVPRASADLRDLVLGLYDTVRGIRAGQRRTSDNMEVRGEPDSVCPKSRISSPAASAGARSEAQRHKRPSTRRRGTARAQPPVDVASSPKTKVKKSGDCSCRRLQTNGRLCPSPHRRGGMT